MGWKGKVIGGALGSLLGPWGAAIGVGVGHMFDKGSEQIKNTQLAFQAAFFGCLAKMAKADGRISPQEIKAIEEIMTRMDYTPEMREAAIATFRDAKDSPYTAADYLEQLAALIQYNQQLGITFLTALLNVAAADSDIHRNEHEILLAAERAFRLPPGTVDSLLGSSSAGSNTPTSIENAYQTLGCTPDMPTAEIKRIYRAKCMEYHPDKLASKGLPEEFMNFANQKLAEFNTAYDTIMKSRSS